MISSLLHLLQRPDGTGLYPVVLTITEELLLLSAK